MPEVKSLVTGGWSPQKGTSGQVSRSCLSITSDKVYTDYSRNSADANYFLPKSRELVTLLQNNYL